MDRIWPNFVSTSALARSRLGLLHVIFCKGTDVANGTEQFLNNATVCIANGNKVVDLMQKYTNYISDFREFYI